MAVDHPLAQRPLERPARLGPPVPGGPRAYRRSVRQRGPLVGLLPPAALGLVGAVMLRGSTSLARGVGGFVATCLAAPGLLAAGIPFADGSGRMLLGVALSAALWVAIGLWAAIRATRLPVATWRDYWREYAWLAAGAWVGVLGAVVLGNLFLGSALL